MGEGIERRGRSRRGVEDWNAGCILDVEGMQAITEMPPSWKIVWE